MKFSTLSKLFSILMLLALWFALSIMTVSGSGALVVYSLDYQGWDFSESINPDPINSLFAEGPGTPPLGTGSFTFNIGTGQKYYIKQEYGTLDTAPTILPTSIFSGGVPTNTFNLLSYSTYTNSGALASNVYTSIYMFVDPSQPIGAINIPTTLSPPFDEVPNCIRVGFSPPSNPADDTWRTYTFTDTTSISSWMPGCFGAPIASPWATWADFKAEFPNAQIWRISLNIGDTADNYVGYAGALDNVNINGTIYDFELNPPVTPAESVVSTPVIGCVLAPPSGLDIANAPDNTYCTSLISNGAVVAYPGAVPQNLINAGVIRAIDIFRLEGGQSIATFPNYAQVCLLGVGRFIYMDATGTPRQQVEMPSTTRDSGSNAYTCAWIPNPGTVALINN